MKNRRKRPGLKILSLEGPKVEKFLLICFLVCLVLLVAAQILMTNPDIRVLLTGEEKVEGVFLDKTDVLYDKGVLVIELVNHESMDNLWVMVNGTRAVSFDGDRQVSVQVRDADLIEVDGTEVEAPVKVRVSSCSSDVELLIDNSVLEVNGNIGVLARARLK